MLVGLLKRETELLLHRLLLTAMALVCADCAAVQPGSGQIIPFELTQGRPFVRASINGKPVTLLLDLGAYDTLALNHADTDATAATRTATNGAFLDAEGKRHDVTGLHLDKLIIGATSFGTIDGSVVTGEGHSYIGAGLFKKNLLVFDYPHHQLRLYNSGDASALRRECGTRTFPLDVKNSLLKSYLYTDGKVLTAAFDTGANYSVLRPSALKLNLAEPLPGAQPAMHSLQSVHLNQSRLDRLETVLIEFKGPPVDIVLGANFFEGRVVCLDGAAGVGAM
jgi:hypothetical protein